MAGVIFVALMIGLLGACDNSANTKPGASKSSVSALLAKLPNLKPLGIDSCSYRISKSSTMGRLPSPSDVKMELIGTAQLAQESSKTLRSSFEWKPILRDDVPASLLTILPAGELLVSHKLNMSFADNPTYAHGFVVILGRGDSSRIFVISTDMDHPIE